MLVLSRKLNEKIMIGDDIEVIVVEINKEQIKLGINAPKKIKVFRSEVYDEIQNANRQAADSRQDAGLVDTLNENFKSLSLLEPSKSKKTAKKG